MGNSLRCCLACVLPCGALDLIRIVHLNGYVEEITRPITAGEILKNNPNHVLSKPSSQGVVRKILILSPESELKRGSIYFLIPDSSLPDKKKIKKKAGNTTPGHHRHKTSKRYNHKHNNPNSDEQNGPTPCEKYLEDVVICSAGKEHRHRRRHSRSGSVSVWRPHLESINED